MMKKLISQKMSRVLLAAVLGTAGLSTAACKKDPANTVAEYKDYSAIDEDIIKKYLADNAITTAQRQNSGLYFLPVTTNAAGVRATAGRVVSVLYTGRLMDGTIFDASSRHGTGAPITFKLGVGQVIKGWDEGIALMRKGEKAELLIPSALAYGPSGQGTIPPNAVLRFEVELTNVQ